MATERAPFRMGRLDRVHIRVPDRAEAARWYAEHLGFESVEAYDFWATGIEGGPLQISADGGNTTLAPFEAGERHPMIPQQIHRRSREHAERVRGQGIIESRILLRRAPPGGRTG